MAVNYEGLQASLGDIGSALGQQAREKAARNQPMQDALQMLLLKAKAEQLAKQSDPFYQMQQKYIADYLQSQGQPGPATSAPSSAPPVSEPAISPTPATGTAEAPTLRPQFSDVARPALVPTITMDSRKGGFNLKLSQPSSAGMGTSTRQDAIDTAKGIIEGITPPDPQSSSFRDRTAVNAELARNKYDLKTANLDWQSAKKFYGSMNSTSQIRLRQAINSVSRGLDNLDQLNQEYKRTGFTPTNKAQLVANSKGVGAQAELAVKYLTQLAVIQDELSQVFMGGNSPTEKFLEQAQNILKGDFTMKQLQSVIDTLRQNLRYRLNSINQVQTYSPSNKTAEEAEGQAPLTMGAENSQNKVGKYTLIR